MQPLIAALISAAATIGAAVIAYRASQKRNEVLAVLAKANDHRALSAAELDAINVQTSAAEQLGAVVVQSAATGEVRLKLVYPGNPVFRSYSRELTSRSSESVNYSAVVMHLDGEQVGSGNGESGFQLNLKAPVGRHTLVFSWTGSRDHDRERYDGDLVSRSEDRSGRAQLIVWFVRGGACALHLHQDFSVDHAEPAIVLATCYNCRMPGSRVCKCSRKYCSDHSAVVRERSMCLECMKESVQLQFTVAAALAGLAALSGLFFWFLSR